MRVRARAQAAWREHFTAPRVVAAVLKCDSNKMPKRQTITTYRNSAVVVAGKQPRLLQDVDERKYETRGIFISEHTNHMCAFSSIRYIPVRYHYQCDNFWETRNNNGNDRAPRRNGVLVVRIFVHPTHKKVLINQYAQHHAHTHTCTHACRARHTRISHTLKSRLFS